MIGFRENEKKNCNFFPPLTKSRNGSPYLHIFFSSALKLYDEQLYQVLTM